MAVALADEGRPGVDDGAEESVGFCGHGDLLDPLVAEPRAGVETSTVPADARAALEDEERDPGRELRELLEENRQDFAERSPVVDLRNRRADFFQSVTGARGAFHQTHRLVRKRQDSIFIDSLFVARHPLLDAVELLQ